ncbi:MAG TPA: rhodanese-like domain-containing protein, partial [Candidatus Dormibacteraeota bacterium]|nr:rhodanese-like domain-containing protein [Candidatus Dormibacteraeota bacterium]
MSTEELQDLLAAGQPVTVVDIRTPDDREWSIPGSVQVDAYDAVKSGSLGSLASRDFPPGLVVTICGTGRTAATATALLRATGVQAVTLEGGMRAWSLAWNTAQATISG